MFARLKAGLARSTAQLTSELSGVFTKERLDADTIRDLEDALIRADVGTELAHKLAAEVGQGRYDTDIAEHELRRILADAIAKLKNGGATTLIIQPSPFAYRERGRFIDVAAEQGIGTIFAFPVARREIGSPMAY